MYEYAYVLLICKVVAYVLIIIAGLWTKNIKEMLLFLLAFIPLRQYAGGIHLEKPEKCIVATGILVSASGQYLRRFPIPDKISYIVWVVALYLILILAPVDCKNKRLDLKEQIVYKKRLGILLGVECLLILAIATIRHYLWISKVIMFAHGILSMSLILGKLRDKF